MAKLTNMPHQGIVDGFKGKLDFYYWKGIPCVRAWPHWPAREPTEREAAWQAEFRRAVWCWNQMDAAWKVSYNTMAKRTKYTGRDLFMRSFLSGIHYTGAP